jgi:hypothetical protein
MNGDLHIQILDAYFWRFVDDGYLSAATPLFTGIYEGYPLSQIVANRFGLQLHEAKSAIDIARKEVAL